MTTDTTELHDNKEKLYSELQDLSKHITTAIAELKDRREKRNALTQHAQEQKTLRKELSAVIKEKIAHVKELRAKRGDRPRPTERTESPGKIREEIARIERKIETSAMDFTEEQKLTKILKEKKALLAKLGGESDLDKEIRTLSKEIDKLKKDSDVAHEQVTKAAKESQEHHERILELSKQVEAWKAREGEIKTQYQSVKEQISASMPADLPKKARKTKAEPTAEDKETLKIKAAEVEEKVKQGKKLTTEDLLAFQAQK